MFFDMPDCGGCSTCEIACSFHHTGAFKPSLASIKIIRRDNNEPGFKVLLIEATGVEGIACDGCKGVEEPLCVEICHKKEQLENIIKEYLEIRAQKK